MRKLILILFLVSMVFAYDVDEAPDWADWTDVENPLGTIQMPVFKTVEVELNSEGAPPELETLLEYSVPEWTTVTETEDGWLVSMKPTELGVFALDFTLFNLDTEYFEQAEATGQFQVKVVRHRPSYNFGCFGDKVYE